MSTAISRNASLIPVTTCLSSHNFNGEWQWKSATPSLRNPRSARRRVGPDFHGHGLRRHQAACTEQHQRAGCADTPACSPVRGSRERRCGEYDTARFHSELSLNRGSDPRCSRSLQRGMPSPPDRERCGRLRSRAFRELGEDGLWCCGAGEPEPAAQLSCDIRRGYAR